MPSYSLAAAEHDLANLMERASAGEEVIITDDRGHVVEMRARENLTSPELEAGTLAWLSERRRQGPFVSISSVELLRQMYEEE